MRVSEPTLPTTASPLLIPMASSSFTPKRSSQPRLLTSTTRNMSSAASSAMAA